MAEAVVLKQIQILLRSLIAVAAENTHNYTVPHLLTVIENLFSIKTNTSYTEIHSVSRQ